MTRRKRIRQHSAEEKLLLMSDRLKSIEKARVHLQRIKESGDDVCNEAHMTTAIVSLHKGGDGLEIGEPGSNARFAWRQLSHVRDSLCHISRTIESGIIEETISMRNDPRFAEVPNIDTVPDIHLMINTQRRATDKGVPPVFENPYGAETVAHLQRMASVVEKSIQCEEAKIKETLGD